MVADLTTVVYYGLDDGGQPLGLSGMASGDTLSPTILDEKVLNASGTLPAMVGGNLVAINFSAVQPNTKANSTFVYDADGGEYVSQVPAFVMEAVGGGPFEQPVVVTTQASVTRVNINATLSGGDAYFGNVHASGSVGVSSYANVGGELGVSSNAFVSGNLGVSSNANVSGNLAVTGTTTLNDTISVSSQNSVATMTGALPTIGTLISPTPPGAFCFLSAVGDGTATTAEVSFGAGTEIQGVSSVGRGTENGYYLWDSANNELEVSSDGVYKVDFVGVVLVDAAMDITVSMYTGATLVHRYDLRVHSVTDPHNLVSTWVGWVQTSTPISVTINGGAGSDNAQILQSSTVFVQRLA